PQIKSGLCSLFFKFAHKSSDLAVLDLVQNVRLPQRLPNLISTTLENRPGNPQFLHLVNQSGAFQSKLRGGAFGATDHPTNFFQHAQNKSAFGVPQSSNRPSRSNGDTSSSCRRQRIG